MRVIVCLDNKNGMLFHQRRQSRDRTVIADILGLTAGSCLYIEPYSAPLFSTADRAAATTVAPAAAFTATTTAASAVPTATSPAHSGEKVLADGVRCDADFLTLAGEADYCFVEKQALSPYAAQIEELILYRWNRVYPADVYFDLPFPEGWQLCEATEFAGYSHEVVTREIYKRQNGDDSKAYKDLRAVKKEVNGQ